MKKKGIQDKVSDTLGIPRDIISDIPRVVITGDGDIHIEGFLGISEYSTERISIKAKKQVIVFFGENLGIEEITDEYINLKGKVRKVEYM